MGERRVEEDIAIEVRDPDLCPRYAGRVIRGVKIGESPLWLKARLCHVGMRPISNVVDVTNYVQWALGQPLHAFDLHTIRGARIVVRRAYAGERLVTLDDEERVLTDDMLVIADAERASVVAGIMGGLDSEITSSTTDILLEGANFSGPSIMRTSSALALRSEASTRYEKGLDPEAITPALDMACKMFVELCGGTVSVGTVDVRVPPRAQTDPEVAERAYPPDSGQARGRGRNGHYPQQPGMLGSRQKGRIFRWACPATGPILSARSTSSKRWLACTVWTRSLPRSPGGASGRGGLNGEQKRNREIEDLLVGAGLSQVISYSFGDDKWPDRLRLAPDDPRRQGVVLANPLSGDQSVMQTMLLPGLLDTARRNGSVREERVPVFEVGRVFLPHEETDAGLPAKRRTWASWWPASGKADSWNRSDISVDYFLVKGLVERLAAAMHLPARLQPGRTSRFCTRARARQSAMRQAARWVGSGKCTPWWPRRMTCAVLWSPPNWISPACWAPPKRWSRFEIFWHIRWSSRISPWWCRLTYRRRPWWIVFAGRAASCSRR